jgi:putative nucleotidyltransferase with HDIG domain
MTKILSQDEVDALLKGMVEGEIETEGDQVREDLSGGISYDFAYQERIIRPRMALFLVIVEALVRKRAEEGLKNSFEKQHRAFEWAINALATIIETIDPYVAGHQKRVAHLARAIAQELGLPQDQTEGILVIGLLHDLGKIAVPAEILTKPSKLSEYEFNLIKTHPQVGHDILKNIEFPWPVAQAILQHHERLDGSGYPFGLLDQDIILEAKILAVADVVEAMASHRLYRPALGIDKALEEVSQYRAIRYDPNVVDACLKLFTKKGFKFD